MSLVHKQNSYLKLKALGLTLQKYDELLKLQNEFNNSDGPKEEKKKSR